MMIHVICIALGAQTRLDGIIPTQLSHDWKPRQHSTTQFFTGHMTFLPPNQQHQST